MIALVLHRGVEETLQVFLLEVGQVLQLKVYQVLLRENGKNQKVHLKNHRRRKKNLRMMILMEVQVLQLEVDQVLQLEVDQLLQLEVDQVLQLEVDQLLQLEVDQVLQLEVDQLLQLEVDQVLQLEVDQLLLKMVHLRLLIHMKHLIQKILFEFWILPLKG
jgi:CRISPR/Cas system-associated protein endoribonuclease Cas2